MSSLNNNVKTIFSNILHIIFILDLVVLKRDVESFYVLVQPSLLLCYLLHVFAIHVIVISPSVGEFGNIEANPVKLCRYSTFFVSVDFDHFEILRAVGKGSFGKVSHPRIYLSATF